MPCSQSYTLFPVKYIPPPPQTDYTYSRRARGGCFITTLVLGLLLSGLGILKSEAQIVINVPFGQTLNLGSLSGNSYLFQGAGQVNLNGNNTAVTGAVTIEGVSVILNSLPNISSLEIKNGGRVFLRGGGGRISNDASVSLDSGTIWTRDLIYSTAVEEVGDLILSGGLNQVILTDNSFSMNYGFSYRLAPESLVRQSSQATLSVILNDGFIPIGEYDGDATFSYLVFKNTPSVLNSILPYSVMRYETLGASRSIGYGDRHFSTVTYQAWQGGWSIGKLASYSTSGQASWNSSALNISIAANQTLNNNRTINSLRLVDNHTVNLNGHTLSVNAGAFLTAREGRAQFINNGTITTNQDRYFFHIYGTRLSVSSNISGTGKELVKSGPGELVLYGAQANTYTGTTYVHEGTLVLNKSPNAKAVGNIVVGDGGGVDTLRLDQSHQIDDLATVRLKGASRAKNMTAQGVLQFNGAGGLGLTEKIHTLEIEGQGVINFAGGTTVRPNVLETTRVLMPTADDTIFIQNWIEYADYFLVTRALAPNASALARIWFEGWAPGAKLRDYNTSHWEIVPLGAPEPATYGAILAAAGIALWRLRQLKQRSAKDEK